ncbi:hypothetical protein ACROYT_G018580 [Oculina patagonica]
MNNFTSINSSEDSSCPYAVSIFFTTAMAIISSVAFIGNILVIFSVFKTPSLRTSANYYYVNMAVSDFLASFTTWPMYLTDEIITRSGSLLEESLANVLCKVGVFFRMVSLVVSILIFWSFQIVLEITVPKIRMTPYRSVRESWTEPKHNSTRPMVMNNSSHIYPNGYPSCPYAVSIFFTVAMTIISIAAIIGNCLVIFSVYKTPSLRTSTNYYYINMAVSDIFAGVTIWPLYLTDEIITSTGSLIQGPLATVCCKVGMFFRLVSTIVSILSLVLIAIDRFIATVFPLKASLITQKMRALFIFATWLISMAYSAMAIITLAAFIGNMLVIVLVYKTPSLRTSTNYYYVNMAASDFLASLTTWPLYLTNEIITSGGSLIQGPFATFGCKVGVFFRLVSTIVSILSLVLIAADRFIATIFPLKATLITQKLRASLLFGTWLISIAYCIPMFYYFRVEELEEGREDHRTEKKKKIVFIMDNSTHIDSSDDSSCPNAVSIFFTTAMAIISSAAFIGNSLVITSVYKTPSLRTSTNYYYVNMAASDFLASLTTWPLYLTNEIITSSGSLIQGSLATVGCKVGVFFRMVSTIVSILSLVLIAVDRFIATSFPLKAALTTQKLRATLLLGTWLISIAYCIPMFYYFRVEEVGHEKFCTFAWNGFALMIYNIAGLALFVVMPLITIIILYSSIMRALSKIPKQDYARCRSHRIEITVKLKIS